MAVDDLWRLRDGSPSKRDGRGRRWRVRVQGYPSTLHRTRAEAERVELDRLRAGPPVPASDITVGAMLDGWLAGKQRLSRRGLLACRTAATQVRLRWDDVLVGAVTRPDVAEWIGGLQSQDMTARRDGPPVLRPAAGSTKAKALQALSGALEIALDLGLVESNPCRKVSPGRQLRRAVVVLTPAELAALADAAGPRDDDRAMVWTLGTTGLRIGEGCALDVGDVDARRARLLVRSSKTGEPREVPVAASVLAGLRPEGRRRTEPLFTSPKGARVSVRNWRVRVFDPAAEAIGRPDITPHVLRHTAASLAIRAGADVKAVQRMLGHASAKLTLDTYGHLFDAALDDVAARLDALVAP